MWTGSWGPRRIAQRDRPLTASRVFSSRYFQSAHVIVLCQATSTAPAPCATANVVSATRTRSASRSPQKCRVQLDLLRHSCLLLEPAHYPPPDGAFNRSRAAGDRGIGGRRHQTAVFDHRAVRFGPPTTVTAADDAIPRDC